MHEPERPFAYVAGIRPDEPDATSRVTLDLFYGQKQAQIELPVGLPVYDREPGVEVYRRDLLELLEALQAVASPSGRIFWPPRQRT